MKNNIDINELTKEAITKVCELLYEKGVYKSAIRDDNFVYSLEKDNMYFTTEEMVDFYIDIYCKAYEDLKDKIANL
jgi:hypothetical protein